MAVGALVKNGNVSAANRSDWLEETQTEKPFEKLTRNRREEK